MELKPYPGHKRIKVILGGALVIGTLVMTVIMASISNNMMMTLLIIGGVTLADVVMFMFILASQNKQTHCPGCQKLIKRDPESPHGELHFPCVSCSTVWVA